MIFCEAVVFSASVFFMFFFQTRAMHAVGRVTHNGGGLLPSNKMSTEFKNEICRLCTVNGSLEVLCFVVSFFDR